MWKKSMALICAAVWGLSMLAGCATGSNTESSQNAAQQEAASGEAQERTAPTNPIQANEAKSMMNVGALQGPTGLGLVSLMEQNEQNQSRNIYEFTIAGAPDEISGKIVSGELDVAYVPTNLGAVLYNRTEGKVKNIGISTLGVLYLLQNNDDEKIESFSDLSGKTIYSTGQGATQEYVLNYLLQENGVDDAEIEYKSEHAELATLVAEGSVEYALLPEPFVTTVTTRNDAVEVALDVTKEWEAVTGGTQLAMGAVIVRADFLEKNPQAVDRFLEDLMESVRYVNGHVEEAAALSGKYDIVNEEVALKAIPQCNIVCITAEQMKGSVSAFLQVLYQADPSSVGGSLPDDAFYYLG